MPKAKLDATFCLTAQCRSAKKRTDYYDTTTTGFVLGGRPEKAAFAYSRKKGISYAALVASVREVDPDVLEPMKQAATQLEEAPVIEAIKVALGEGIRTKMKLATHVSRSTPVSRAEVVAIIDKYTGDDPVAHHWRFEVGARGAHVFVPLDRPESPREAKPA